MLAGFRAVFGGGVHIWAFLGVFKGCKLHRAYRVSYFQVKAMMSGDTPFSATPFAALWRLTAQTPPSGERPGPPARLHAPNLMGPAWGGWEAGLGFRVESNPFACEGLERSERARARNQWLRTLRTPSSSSGAHGGTEKPKPGFGVFCS